MTNLFDAEAKDAYCELVREGFLRFEAARRLGFKLATVKKHYEADPDFKEALDEAQLEATEPVEKVLYDAALNKEPWAVSKWLAKRDKDRWGEEDIKVKHEIEIGPGLSGVAAIMLELKKRQELRELEAAEAAKLPLLSRAPAIDVTFEEIIPDRSLSEPNTLRKAPPVA